MAEHQIGIRFVGTHGGGGDERIDGLPQGQPVAGRVGDQGAYTMDTGRRVIGRDGGIDRGGESARLVRERLGSVCGRGTCGPEIGQR